MQWNIEMIVMITIKHLKMNQIRLDNSWSVDILLNKSKHKIHESYLKNQHLIMQKH